MSARDRRIRTVTTRLPWARHAHVVRRDLDGRAQVVADEMVRQVDSVIALPLVLPIVMVLVSVRCRPRVIPVGEARLAPADDREGDGVDRAARPDEPEPLSRGS